MKIEPGRRYRFEPNGASAYMLPSQIVTLDLPLGGGGAPSIMFSSGAVMHVLQDGTIAGLGRLVELEPEPGAPTPAILRSSFGQDAGEFARLQRVFREGRDLTLGTGW